MTNDERDENLWRDNLDRANGHVTKQRPDYAYRKHWSEQPATPMKSNYEEWTESRDAPKPAPISSMGQMTKNKYGAIVIANALFWFSTKDIPANPGLGIAYAIALWFVVWATLQRVRNVGYRDGVWPTILYAAIPFGPLVLSCMGSGTKGPIRG